MVHRVNLTSRARKDLASVPRHISDKFQSWVDAVKHDGLENVMKLPGYHDEPLSGKRKGERSIRLNKAWRAIYKIEADGAVSCVSVKEVTHHGY